MKISAYATPALLVALAVSVAAHAEPVTVEVDEPTPFAAAAGESISVDAARQLAAANAAYSQGDYSEAFKLYRSISTLGVAAAQYRIAMMYLSGQGARKSASQAEYWMRTAAKGRYPGAEEALALMRAMAGRG